MYKVLLLFTCCGLLPLFADTVPVHMVSLSPQVFPAVDRDGFTRLDYRMSISAFPEPARVNHELASATLSHGFTHEGFFLIEDPIIFETFPIAFVLDVPPLTDVNTNGVHDFYDVDASVEGVQTQGFHDDGTGGAVGFFATWNRAAGARAGSVIIEMPFLGRRFVHEMSLIQYDGVFEFTMQGTNLTGTVTLTNAAVAANVITGPFTARAVSTNQLAYDGSSWLDESGAIYRFFGADLLDLLASNFVTFLAFDDGWPGTGDADYFDWALIIPAQDVNGNGLADLAESAAPLDVPPRLHLEYVGQSVRMTIFGVPGQRLVLLSAGEVDAATWMRERGIVLSTDRAQLSLPAPDIQRFYRVRVE